jgi:hypothetical protein
MGFILQDKNVNVITCLNGYIPGHSGQPKRYTIIYLQVKGKSPSIHAALVETTSPWLAYAVMALLFCFGNLYFSY